MPAVVLRPGAPAPLTPPTEDAPLPGATPAELLTPPILTTTVLPESDHRHDTLHALRNALKLGGSLVVTLALSFGMKPLVAHHFGKAIFGQVSFADAFTTAFFVVVTLGVDTYIRREVPVRPD